MREEGSSGAQLEGEFEGVDAGGDSVQEGADLAVFGDLFAEGEARRKNRSLCHPPVVTPISTGRQEPHAVMALELRHGQVLVENDEVVIADHQGVRDADVVAVFMFEYLAPLVQLDEYVMCARLEFGRDLDRLDEHLFVAHRQRVDDPCGERRPGR